MTEKINIQTSRVAIFTRENALKLVLLSFAVWLHAASSLLAATTLPSAVREFGGGNLIGWAFALYLLGSILAGSSNGTLIRIAGLRVGLTLAALLYLIGSLICAAAPDMNVVLAGRLVQGVGGGYLVALAYVAIRRWFAPQELPKVIALVSAIWSMSAFAGPLVGGTFATFGNWRLAFVAVAIQAAVFIALALVVSPKLPRQENEKRPSIPFLRLGLICLSVLFVAFAGAEIHPVKSPVFAALGIMFFVIVLRRDGVREENRLFPNQPLNPSNKVGAGLLLIFSASLASMSFMVYGPIILETLHNVSPLAAGYIIAFESVSWGGAAVLVAGLKSPNEGRLIHTGTAFLVIALVGFAFCMKSGPLFLILIFAGIQGAGFGIMYAYIVKRITEHARKDEEDVTSSAIPTMQQLGFAFGAAMAGIVANSFGFGEDVNAASAQIAAFWIFVAFIPVALVSFMAGMRLTR